jgi:hypothetical protein
MRKVLLLLLLPLAGCAATASVSMGGLRVLQSSASLIDANHINLTLLNQCVDKLEIISLRTGFKPGEQIAPYGSIWEHKLYAGGENRYVEVTLRAIVNGRIVSVTRQFPWSQVEDITWTIGRNIQGEGYRDDLSLNGTSICR